MVNHAILKLTGTVNGGIPMNEKFFTLPEEKQRRIIDAGYEVFSRNSYKKSPVGEIARAAGISKSLLFHYFHNKKELYLFLWNTASQLTMDTLKDYGCYEPTDLFEMMRRGLYAKIAIMEKYPNVTGFVLKAFYEKEPEIACEIQKSYAGLIQSISTLFMPKLNPEYFRPGLDTEMIFKTMYWTSEGYLWKALQQGTFNLDQLEKDTLEMLNFWKTAYCRENPEESDGFHYKTPERGVQK